MKTYHWGIPTHNSSQATIVAPFHCENGVPSLRTFSTSSCFLRCRLSCSLNSIYSYTVIYDPQHPPMHGRIVIGL